MVGWLRKYDFKYNRRVPNIKTNKEMKFIIKRGSRKILFKVFDAYRSMEKNPRLILTTIFKYLHILHPGISYF